MGLSFRGLTHQASRFNEAGYSLLLSVGTGDQGSLKLRSTSIIGKESFHP
jgi:hypothetical protein